MQQRLFSLSDSSTTTPRPHRNVTTIEEKIDDPSSSSVIMTVTIKAVTTTTTRLRSPAAVPNVVMESGLLSNGSIVCTQLGSTAPHPTLNAHNDNKMCTIIKTNLCLQLAAFTSFIRLMVPPGGEGFSVS